MRACPHRPWSPRPGISGCRCRSRSSGCGSSISWSPARRSTTCRRRCGCRGRWTWRRWGRRWPRSPAGMRCCGPGWWPGKTGCRTRLSTRPRRSRCRWRTCPGRPLLAADAVAPFDLAAGPVIRACLVRLAADEHMLVLSVHHAVFDEWSEGIFKRELTALYQAARSGESDRLPPLGVQYADFAVWQRGWLTAEVLDGQLAYWRQQLAGAPVLELL